LSSSVCHRSVTLRRGRPSNIYTYD
jgi:hypothetical protein